MSGEAEFRRIAADIRRRIQEGTWAPGQGLPSRAAMASEYHVHEQTIRLAYDLLRRSALLDGERRKGVYVAHPPAMRTLTDVDADWPYGSEKTDTRSQAATDDLAGRLDVPVGALLHHEAIECLEPGGRSAMLVSSWWRGRRRPHVSATAELGVALLTEVQAHALGLLVDSLAYRVTRTRLDPHGAPVETADLILPLDRWTIRLG